MKKPVLVGLHNPNSRDMRFALWPYPPGCTGWRVWQMLTSRIGVDQYDYLTAFTRRNLSDMIPLPSQMPPKWLRQMLNRGDIVVLFGEEVRRAFGLKRLLLHPQEIGGVIYRCVPHPLGHFYQNETKRELVAMLLEELYGCQH